MNQQGETLRRLRHEHEARVLHLVRERGRITRAELAAGSGLSRTTLSEIIATLRRRGLLRELPTEPPASSRGRPPMQLSLDPSAGIVAGFDLGHDHIALAVANVAHEIVAHVSRPVPARTPWARRVAVAVELARTTADEYGLRMETLEAVGVGIVGPVGPTWRHDTSPGTSSTHDRNRGRVVEQGIADAFGIPVLIDNNVRLGALAEAQWGSVDRTPDLVYVLLSHGVGAGVMVEGAEVAGVRGAAGEIGHVTVVPDGPMCWCGRRGCLETQVSRPAILAAYAGRTGRRVDLDGLLAAVAAGDADARAVVAHAGRLVGMVLATVCSVTNPAAVIIGGDLAKCGDVLLEPLESELRERSMRRVHDRLVVSASKLAERAAVFGAVLLALRETNDEAIRRVHPYLPGR